MDCFEYLPEGCISEVISRTSPLDAIRSSGVSCKFKSAAESDIVWEMFLPPDYREIVSRSATMVDYPNKKGLYASLCNSYILLDDGKLSFSLDKKSGKKCYMLAARKLIISWGDTPCYWKWTPRPDSRFSEVAELQSVCWLDIRGKLETRALSPNTSYAAYLVFKLAERSYGLEFAKATTRFVDRERDEEAEDRAATVLLQPRAVMHRQRAPEGRRPQRRKDGWMEILLGEFYNEEGDEGEVEARLIEIRRLFGKAGLITEGIEFRPKN